MIVILAPTTNHLQSSTTVKTVAVENVQAIDLVRGLTRLGSSIVVVVVVVVVAVATAAIAFCAVVRVCVCAPKQRNRVVLWPGGR